MPLNVKPKSAKADSPLTRGNGSAPEQNFPLVKGVARSAGGFCTSPQSGKSIKETNLGEILNSKYVIKANTRFKPRAKHMSRNMTKAEQIVWFKVLAKRQLLGYKFTKQKQVFNYILDFYCSKLLLAIEVDGESHAKTVKYDLARTKFLNSININVVRISNTDVYNNIDGVFEYLSTYIKNLESKLLN